MNWKLANQIDKRDKSCSADRHCGLSQLVRAISHRHSRRVWKDFEYRTYEIKKLRLNHLPPMRKQSLRLLKNTYHVPTNFVCLLCFYPLFPPLPTSLPVLLLCSSCTEQRRNNTRAKVEAKSKSKAYWYRAYWSCSAISLLRCLCCSYGREYMYVSYVHI